MGCLKSPCPLSKAHDGTFFFFCEQGPAIIIFYQIMSTSQDAVILGLSLKLLHYRCGLRSSCCAQCPFYLSDYYNILPVVIRAGAYSIFDAQPKRPASVAPYRGRHVGCPSGVHLPDAVRSPHRLSSTFLLQVIVNHTTQPCQVILRLVTYRSCPSAPPAKLYQHVRTGYVGIPCPRQCP